MGLINDFKAFAVKGNAIDLAVGVAVGAAFNQIVSSLVKDIITPPVGFLTGGLDFSNLFLSLSGGDYPTLKAAQEAGAATINLGLFINAGINFLIVAWVLFVVVRLLTRVRSRFEAEQAAAPPPPPGAEERLLAEIRDLLQAQVAAQMAVQMAAQEQGPSGTSGNGKM